MLITVEDERKPITEWAEDYGIPCSLIRSRLRRGWSEERAVTEPMIVRRGEKLPADAALDLSAEQASPRADHSGGRQAQRYEHAGLSLAISEWSQRLGIHELTIRRRLYAGASIEEALTTVERRGRPRAKSRPTKFGPKARLHEHNGLYLTIPEWADRIGVNKGAIYERLRKGASIAEALTLGDHRGGARSPGRNPKLLECNGEALSIAQWAERTGLSHFTIRSRLALGWSVERALTQPSRKDMPRLAKPKGERAVRRDAVRITFDGLSLTYREWAERTGIAYHTIKRRLQLGWSVERALTEAVSSTPGPAPRPLEFNGEALTVAEWSQRLGIHEDSLRNRLNHQGWTVERALTTGNIQGRSHLNQAA